MKKLIVEARVNEYQMRGPNSHVPYLPSEQQIVDALRALMRRNDPAVQS